jgi:glycerol-3-phosphate dehydrogenase
MTPDRRLRYGFDSPGDDVFDLVVVGGGILGACAAWEGALRGLAVALLERGDFGHATSANSLKIAHGGLRYLQHLDLRRFRESVQERSLWLRKAPHLVEPLPVLFPAGGSMVHSRPILRTGLLANDLLSMGRNRGLEPSRRLPQGRLVSGKELARRVPELAGGGAPGGVLFHDALFRFPERLVLEVVQAATEAGAVVANYMEFVGAVRSQGKLTAVEARDTLSGAEVQIQTRAVLNAAGAGSEVVAFRLTGDSTAVAPAWSSAVNLVVKGRGHDAAFALPARAASDTAPSRQLFVVPWRGQTMIGTGHYHLPEGLPRPGDVQAIERVKQADASCFLEEVNRAWPGPEPFGMDDIELIHWGLLPCLEGESGEPVELLRRERVIDHGAQGVAGAFTLLGVKFTTGRRAAQDVLDHVCDFLGHRTGRGASVQAVLPSTPPEPIDRLQARMLREYAGLVSERVSRNLTLTYGARAGSVLQLVASDPSLAEPVVPGFPVIRAQLVHGVRSEMARRAEDLVWRRTELGLLGPDHGKAMEVAGKVVEAEAHS